MNKWVHRILLVLGFLPLLGIGVMGVFLMVLGEVLDSVTMEQKADKHGQVCKLQKAGKKDQKV